MKRFNTSLYRSCDLTKNLTPPNTYVNGSDEQNTFLDFDYWDFITLYRLRI